MMLSLLPQLSRFQVIGRIPQMPQQHFSLAGIAWLQWMRSNAGASRSVSSMAEPSIALLNESRGVLRLGGEDVYHFLNASQGITTNDVTLLRKGNRDMLYSAFLNAQGRFLHDAFLYATGDPFALLADVDRAHTPDLLRLIKMYKLRAAVDVSDVSEDYDIWAHFGAGADQHPEGRWPADPRARELGQRALLPRSADPALETPTADAAAYRQWRIEQGVAEGASEIPPGLAVPLEYNLDGLNAISFTKGCYVGQELIARTHFRGVVRKRLTPIISSGGALEAGMSVYAEGAARPVGRVQLVGERGAALAVLRLQAALGDAALHAGAADGPAVEAARPSWWPAGWGKDAE